MPRVINDIIMPMTEGTVLLCPESALLNWAGIEQRIDVGQFCYLRRDTSSRQRSHHYFDEDSLDAGRVQAVRKLITYLSDVQRSSKFRPQTVLYRLSHLIRFMNWVDKKVLPGVLVDANATESALSEYFIELRELVSQNKLNKNTAANAQKAIVALLSEFFHLDTFGSELSFMQFERKHIQHTEVPDEQHQGQLVSWSNAFFEAISSLVLEFKPYPCAVEQVENKSGASNRVWLLPTDVKRPVGEEKSCLGWNFEAGEPRSYEELKAYYEPINAKYFRQRASSIHSKTRKILLQANEDRIASIRLFHALFAAQCFAVLFLAETGINITQLVEMRWSPELAESLRASDVVRQGFREVKYRAGGRKISFQVTLGFLPKLRTYLKLREYILQGQEASPLFITRNIHGTLSGLSRRFWVFLYNRFETFGIKLPRVTAREWRAAKQDWLVSHHGPVVAAKLMGHTLETAIKAYTNGTEAAHRAEMSSFLASVEKTVLRAGEEPAGAMQSAVGICADFQHPSPISSGHQVKPDCRSTEGCLFCDKYRIHADDVDIRKLVSCRYCVRITSNRAPSVEEYDGSFGVVLRRIEFLLDELRKRDRELVEQIEKDVDIDGNLDSVWAGKLQQLFELGIA